MIALLRGEVESVEATSVVIVTGGVGYQVMVPARVAAQLRGEEHAQLYTSLVVREDSMTLYGFSEADDRTVFTALQSVSGVGPKIALAALNVFTASALRAALSNRDEAALRRIPGIGKKSAQRLILDVGDKLGSGPAQWESPTGVEQTHSDEVEAALVGLGWSAAQAKAATNHFSGESLNAADLLKAALIYLGGSRG